MKRLWTCALLLLVTSGIATAQDSPKVAPADEYFGRLKMSVLGIRNELVHLETQADQAPAQAESVLPPAALVEDAIRDWEHLYPADPWLAKDVYELTRLYAKVKTHTGHRAAMRTLTWLLAKYPDTEFPDRALGDVFAGIPIDAPQPDATPSPGPVPAPTASP